MFPIDASDERGRVLRRAEPVARSRLDALRLLVIFAVASAGCREDRPPERGPLRRHVLLITVDTLRADHVGHDAYGESITPFVDSLRADGFEFSRAVTPIPRTTQALATVLTGCYPHTTKVRTLYDRMSAGVVSLAELLKDKGYATVAVVSNHLLVPRRGLGRGFDVYDFAGDVRDAAPTTDAVINHLAGHSPDDQIFAWVHYCDPHVPYFPPLSLVEGFAPHYRGRYRYQFGTVKGGTGNRAYPPDLPKARAVYQNPLPAEVNAHVRKLYAAEIRNTDDQIARLVAWLHETFAEDWLIIFTADHGESLGEHNFFYDHGDYVYNASLHVPLVFAFPPNDPLRRAGRCNAWVSLIDIMPTLVDLLELRLPTAPEHPIEGRSLVPYLSGEKVEPRPVFAECGRSYFPGLVRRRVRFDVAGRFRSVIAGDWKLIWTPGQSPDQEYELYNLRVDPAEKSNVYAPAKPQVEVLARLLHNWVRETSEVSPPPTPEDLELLQSLGYVEPPEDS